MIKRWLTQVGNCEFIHKSMRDALGYEEQVNVIEMVDIEQLNQVRNNLKFICQWVVDMDEGKFMDANDCEYFNGVDEAKTHLQDLQRQELGDD